MEAVEKTADTNGGGEQHAETPVMDGFEKHGNWAVVDASGLAVGLPEGVMGNSEVGHLTIGAGQVQYQDLVRVNLAVKEGTIKDNKILQKAFKRAKDGNGRLHYIGLLSDGGVHSHQKHLYKLIEIAKEAGVPKTYIHAIMDGRDTPPKSGSKYAQLLLDELNKMEYGALATVVGRYYAMDRDKRWERVKVAFDTICRDAGTEATESPVAAIEKRYEENQTDEFLQPIVCHSDGQVGDGDTVIFFNYRADRMREINEAMGLEPPFETECQRKDVEVYMFTQYKSQFPMDAVFPPQEMKNTLSEWISKKGLKQFHVAETEKYAHVTFFFNGGKEDQLENEERCMVPSPKVPTYDLQPEMSAQGVADEMCKAIESGDYKFIMCNFAPPDMVGHTGMFEKAIIACAKTDQCIGQIAEACKKNNTALFITSDHGNAEVMYTPEGKPVTSHTTFPVPFVMMDPEGKLEFSRKEGEVADVAPTILNYMGLDIPPEMTGKSFI